MLTLCVDNIVAATRAELLVGRGDKHVSAVVRDSREVTQGTLFVCFAGERVDGNNFAPKAISAGAAAVVLTQSPGAEVLSLAAQSDCAVLRAENDDPTEFLLRLAAQWRKQNPQWAVVGVTGSVGKTTTKDMIACGLKTSFRVHATSGNYNNLIGVPLTVLSASAADEVIVCEMGMNHKGELARLTDVVRPSFAILTNVGTSHIGLLGSREAIARAKAEIVEGIRPTSEVQDSCIGPISSCLILGDDNDFSELIEQQYCRPKKVEVLRVGHEPQSFISCGEARLDEKGFPHFELHLPDGSSREVSLHVPGAAMVPDFLFAITACVRLGVDFEAASAAIEKMPATHMRLELREVTGRPRVIDDSYNASPASMASALEVLSLLPCEGRRIAVLGEMGELGTESQRLHGYVGAYVAAISPDCVIWIGNQAARWMQEAALTMGYSEDRMELFSDVDSALKIMGPTLTKNDLVLVKASRAAGLDKFVEGVLR